MNNLKNQKGNLWIVILSFIAIISTCGIFLLQKNSFLSNFIREKKQEFQCFDLLNSGIKYTLKIIHTKVANNESPAGLYTYKIKDDYPQEQSALATETVNLEIIDERPNTNYCIVIASMRKPHQEPGSTKYVKYTKTAIVKKFVTYPLAYVLVTRNSLLNVNSDQNLNITGHLHSDRELNPSINLLGNLGNINITGNVEARNGISKSGTISISGTETSPSSYIDDLVGPNVYPTTINMPVLNTPLSPDYSPLVHLRDPILGRPDLTTTNTVPDGFGGNPDPPAYSINPDDYLTSAQYVFIRGGAVEPNPPIVAGPGTATWDNNAGILYLSGNIHLPGSAIDSGIIYVEGDIVFGDGYNPPNSAIQIEGNGALIVKSSPLGNYGYIYTKESERGIIHFPFHPPHSNFLNPAGDKTLSVGMLSNGIFLGNIGSPPNIPNTPNIGSIYPQGDIMINAPFCTIKQETNPSSGQLILNSNFNISSSNLIINAELRSYAITTSGSTVGRGIILLHYAGPVQSNANLYSQADIHIVAGTTNATIINGNIAARNYINIYSREGLLTINGDLWAGGWNSNDPYYGITLTPSAIIDQSLILNGDLFAYGTDNDFAQYSWGGIIINNNSGAEYSGKIYTPCHIIIYNSEKNVNSGDVNFNSTADIRSERNYGPDIQINSFYANLHFHGAQIHARRLLLATGTPGYNGLPARHTNLLWLDNGTKIFTDNRVLHLQYDWSGPLKIEPNVIIHSTYTGYSYNSIAIYATGDTFINGDIRAKNSIYIFVKDGNLTINGPSIQITPGLNNYQKNLYFGTKNISGTSPCNVTAYDLKASGAIFSWIQYNGTWSPSNGNITIADGQDEDNQALWCGTGRSYNGTWHGIYIKGTPGTTTTVRGVVKAAESIIFHNNKLNLNAALLAQKKCYLNVDPDGVPNGENDSTLKGFAMALSGGDGLKIGNGFTSISYDSNMAELLGINDEWILHPQVISTTNKKTIE